MDLGRSSHIHITTWGTLSRQKKGQRSKRYGGRLHHLCQSLSPIQQVSTAVSVHDAHLSLCFIMFFSLFSFEAWRRLPTAATEDTYTNTDTQELGFCRMQLATISNACAKQMRKWYSGARLVVCREPERPGTMERKRWMGSRRPQSLSLRHTEVRKITQAS